MAFKIACFSKKSSGSEGFSLKPLKPPAAGGSATKTPVCDTSYTIELHRLVTPVHSHTSPNFDIFTCNFGKPDHGFRSSILRYLCSTKVPLSKISDYDIASNLWFAPPPPIKNSSYAYGRGVMQPGKRLSAKPWLTKGLLKLIRTKNKMFNEKICKVRGRGVKHNSEKIVQYKKFHYLLNRAIPKAKQLILQ